MTKNGVLLSDNGNLINPILRGIIYIHQKERKISD